MEKKIVKMKYIATNNIRTLVDAIKMCIDNPQGLTEDDSYIWDIEYNNDEKMKHLVVFTGAGISEESGLPTFRGENGMWTNDEWTYLASKEALYNETQRSLDFYNMRRKHLSEVKPNHAHMVLAELEKEYKVSIITQNVDDLHERAGSTNVLHLHGEMRKVTGSENPNNPKCIVEKPLEEPILVGDKAADGSQLRPYVVLFGEYVTNMERAYRIAEEADIFVIIGTQHC